MITDYVTTRASADHRAITVNSKRIGAGAQEVPPGQRAFVTVTLPPE